MIKVIIRATFIWFGLFILAFLNGAIREYALKDYLNAHFFSFLTGTLLWTGFVWLIWKRTKIKNQKEAAIVGLYWLILTALVETFLINKVVGKMTWEEILETYNLAEGEYWGLVLLWIGLLPTVIRWLKIRRVK